MSNIKELKDYVNKVMSKYTDSRQPSADEVRLAMAICEMDSLMDIIKALIDAHDKTTRERASKQVWMAFDVEENDVPDDGIVFIRIADDVLEPEDWPLHALRMRGGMVVNQTEIYDGVYTVESVRRWSKSQLVEWANFNPTGSSPKTYHEIVVI